MEDSDIHTLTIYQKEYFEILSEFFIDATGKTHEEFCSPSEFSQAINRLGKELKGSPQKSKKSRLSYETLDNKLRKLYGQESMACFKSAQNINCCKVNLGGSSRFLETQLNATRKTMLISDVVLIPDPVMPWLESSREHEKFKLVQLLQAVYFILHLKDLLSEDFDLPPFLVFPSWEKSLEEKDDQTIESTRQLTADMFSFYVDEDIEKIEDVFELVDSNETEFLVKVEKEGLFISPGGEIGEPVDVALANYRAEAQQWRTKEFNEIIEQAPKGRVILNGIIERVQPQYHLFENSYELRSNPLLCVDAQAHYFKLLSKMTNCRVANLASTDENTSTILSALMSRRLDFLVNITDDQLITLRKSDENISFRHQLREFVCSLPEASIDDIGYVAAEVCAHIESLISNHEKQVSILNGKYEAKHGKTALIAGGGLAVTMVPALAPFLGAALPIAMTAGGKYVADKLEERHEMKVLSGSLLGVIALAKKMH